MEIQCPEPQMCLRKLFNTFLCVIFFIELKLIIFGLNRGKYKFSFKLVNFRIFDLISVNELLTK